MNDDIHEDDDPVSVEVPCYLALHIEIPRSADGDDETVGELALQAAYEWWDQIKWPSDGEMIAALGVETFVSFSGFAECGPMAKLSEGNITYVTPTRIEIER